MQNELDIVTMKIEEAEKKIGDREDKIMDNNGAEKKGGGKLLDHESRHKELSDSIKQNSICI